jgi:hypothetical protein
MKIAIINCGLLRTYQHVFQNQFQHLYLPNQEHSIDTVIVTEQLPLRTTKQTHESILKTYATVEGCKIIIKNIQPYLITGLPTYTEQFRKLEIGLNALQDHPENYDLIIRIRPDLLFDRDILFDNIDSVQGIIGWNSNYTHIQMHDVFFIGKYHHFKEFVKCKHGWLYALHNHGHCFFQKNEGKEAEVQLLLASVYNDFMIKPLDLGVLVLQNEHLTRSKEQKYYKLGVDKPLVLDKDAIIKLK